MKGWRNDRLRHSLARKGIKTKIREEINYKNMINLNSIAEKYIKNKDYQTDYILYMLKHKDITDKEDRKIIAKMFNAGLHRKIEIK